MILFRVIVILARCASMLIALPFLEFALKDEKISRACREQMDAYYLQRGLTTRKMT